MRHVTIKVSEAQEIELSERVAAGGFASLDDYVSSLVRAELKEHAQARLEEQLLEGLRSERLPWTPERLTQIRRNAGLTG